MPEEPPRKRARTKEAASAKAAPKASKKPAAKAAAGVGGSKPKAAARGPATPATATSEAPERANRVSSSSSAAAPATSAAAAVPGTSAAPAGAGSSNSGTAAAARAISAAPASNNANSNSNATTTAPPPAPPPPSAACSSPSVTTAAGAPPPEEKAAAAAMPPPPVPPRAASPESGTASPPVTGISKFKAGLPFLRISEHCRPSLPLGSPLVFLDKDEISIGRLPSCDVVLDSSKVPSMISRTHGHIRKKTQDGEEVWVLTDNQSMNGILVNGSPINPAGHSLQTGDVVIFGRKIPRPEFEYIFEAPPPLFDAAAAEAERARAAAAEENINEQMKKVQALQKQLEAEREAYKKEIMPSQKQRQSKSQLNVADLHSELACSICQDWLVHAATIECSHTFCWACIDQWLVQKHFECPVCRAAVKREPVRTRAVDSIVRKSVDKLSSMQKDEYDERVKLAESELESKKHLHNELEKSVNLAKKRGKNFFHIASDWKRKEKETFQTGIKDYSGNARETYCRLTGLTVQWVHSASEDMLVQALHNLQLQRMIGSPPDEVRQRLLMFLRYG